MKWIAVITSTLLLGQAAVAFGATSSVTYSGTVASAQSVETVNPMQYNSNTRAFNGTSNGQTKNNPGLIVYPFNSTATNECLFSFGPESSNDCGSLASSPYLVTLGSGDTETCSVSVNGQKISWETDNTHDLPCAALPAPTNIQLSIGIQ